MIYYSERTQGEISEGKRYTGQSRGHQAQAFWSVNRFPVDVP